MVLACISIRCLGIPMPRATSTSSMHSIHLESKEVRISKKAFVIISLTSPVSLIVFLSPNKCGVIAFQACLAQLECDVKRSKRTNKSIL